MLSSAIPLKNVEVKGDCFILAQVCLTLFLQKRHSVYSRVCSFKTIWKKVKYSFKIDLYIDFGSQYLDILRRKIVDDDFHFALEKQAFPLKTPADTSLVFSVDSSFALNTF